MATISSRRNSVDDIRTAGGKITRNRRPPPSSRTPYARPSKSPTAEVEDDEIGNPNWLSTLIYPAKVIASGAGKILSFFGNDSEDDSDDEDSEYDDDEGENDESDKVCSPTSKSVNKHKIEQLVLEETFSREEGNQLIRLIKSRMVDTHGTRDQGTPPARNAAIMEARKWLKEKRSGSKEKMEAELDSLSQFTRSEKGSPADMAKSYMQNRPAWGSPSLKHVEFGSPSALGVLNFKEETPTSTLRSSELKRSSFAAGSWNLLDEIRRVRSKATEEFLSATPITKTSLSLFSPVNNRDISESKGNVEAAGQADSTHVIPDHVLHDVGANSFLRYSQDGNVVQSVEHQERPEAVDVSVLKDNKDNEVNESRTNTAENGSVASGHRSGDYAQVLSAADDPRPLEKENGILVNSTEEEQDVHVANILPEPIDVPCTTDTHAVLNGSQNSTSLQEEDHSQDLSQPTADGPTDQPKEAQKEKRSRGYTRRSRAREMKGKSI
ncbi:hypothetical protein RND81_03G117800 [Saponaria officinalis]|uniref:Protein KAKU4 n=1 Tax=Saponaria officinalis TaxID=3572 RepID=A0AAW1M6G7_SAPOF